MKTTTNYGFKKPEDDDFFNVQDFAEMMDDVDTQLKAQENKTQSAGDKASKYKRTTATIPSAGWTGDTAPYTNTITVSGITATNDIQVLPSYDWTTEQAEAWGGAMILSGSQSENTMTLKAYGDKPVIDIPVVILIGDTVEEVV